MPLREGFSIARFDVEVVGHLTLDYIKTPRSTVNEVLGGTPTYVGFSLSRLGFKVGVISTIGHDFSEPHVLCLAKDMELSKVKRSFKPTTRFQISYFDHGRELRLLALCEPIDESTLTSLNEAEAIFIGTVAGEVDLKTLEKVSCLDLYKTLSLQGFLRSFRPNGYVELRTEDRLLPLLGRFNLICGSSEEMMIELGASNLKQALSRALKLGGGVAVATMGHEGSMVAYQGGFLRVPAFKTAALDPTGAGDVYAGVLANYLSRGEDIKWAACVAASAASFVVEGLGPSRFGSKREVEVRASAMLEKVVFQPF